MRIIKILLLCLVANPIFAQLQKGSPLLEGTGSFNFTFKPKDAPKEFESPYRLSLGLNFGYFMDDRNEIGLGLGVVKSRRYLTPISIQIGNYPTGTGRGVSPAIYWRNYLKINDKLAFCSTLSSGFSFSTEEFRSDFTGELYEVKNDLFLIAYGPSLAYRLTDRLGLRGSFGSVLFSSVKYGEAENRVNNFSLNFSPQSLSFGLFLVLKNRGA